MSDEAIQITISGKIDGKIATSIRDISRAAIEADTNLDLLRNALAAFSASSAIRQAANDTRTLRNEIKGATGDSTKLQGAVKGVTGELNQAGAAAGNFAKRLKEARVGGGEMVSVGNNLNGVFRTLIGTFASFFAIQQWAQASDAMITYENRLKVVGQEGEALNQTMGQITDIALRNGQSIDGLSQLYMKVATAQKDLNATGEETIQFLGAVAAGLRIQGGSAQTSAGAMLQLSQAIGSSRVEAQEFNSIVEGMYPIAQAAARGIDGFGGSVSKLQRFIREGGTITGEQLFRGVLSSLDELEGKVALTQLTITQSLQNLRTQFELWTRDTQGAAGLVANAITFIGNNLNILIPIVALFAATWGLVAFAKIAAEALTLTAALVGMLIPLAPLVAMTAAWATILGLVLAAILSVGYALAVLTGRGDEFEQWIADAIGTVQDMAGQLLGLGDNSTVATKALDAMGLTQQALNSAVGQGTAELKAGSSALASNASAAQSWSTKTTKAINTVTAAYRSLNAAKNAALAATASAHYKELQAAGGTIGSFSSVGPAPKPGSPGSSITNLGGPPKKFRQGGSFMVGGARGVDKNLVSFQASRGERVDVLTPQQQRDQRGAMSMNGKGQTFNFYIQTNDAQSFRKSRGQIASDTSAALAG